MEEKMCMVITTGKHKAWAVDESHKNGGEREGIFGSKELVESIPDWTKLYTHELHSDM